MTDRLLDLAIQIQQIPAPTFDEAARGKFVLEMFSREGLSDLQTDSVGNVFARLPGRGSNSPLIVSAHLDTVFPAETDLAIRRKQNRVYGPGLGDNALGVAGLFGLLGSLHEAQVNLPGDLWLVANTGEEGLGDLRGMKAVVEKFGADPRLYLILEGMAFGHIYHKAIGVRRYKIIAHATGGHSWIDYGKPSAIHELSELITKITALRLPANPRTTLNVGRIGGGTSINTLAAEAWMELDLRSAAADALTELVRQVEKLVQAANRPGVRFEARLVGQRPAGEMSIHHPLVALAESCLLEEGMQPNLTTGSTDANIPLSRGYPALVLGLTHGSGAHTFDEYIETGPLEKGLRHLVNFVTQAWK
jgi:acetylornithine deacetylase/succinyl-diaminopimelate desuccinylase-like protein